MSHLETIAARQRKSLLRDLAFAAAIALTAMVSFSSVRTAVHAASAPVQIAQR